MPKSVRKKTHLAFSFFPLFLTRLFFTATIDSINPKLRILFGKLIAHHASSV